MDTFDLYAPELPSGTTILEASAGTGKTFAVAALVTRYVAEGRTTLGELLVITFGRAASQELRERVRDQLRTTERALADPVAARRDDGLVGFLASGVDDQTVEDRRRRLATALADFDGATIATTHEFCRLVLRSLGVAGDTDSHARLVEDLDELVVEVVDDLYLARFGNAAQDPPFRRSVAITLGRAAVSVFRARLEPAQAPADTVDGQRRAFAADVRREVDRRKQRLGVLSFDDLLGRLADALEAADSPARQRMRQHWRVVLVDEFQDTDPIQWQVLDRAFSGHSDLVLIGDPKQAIYAFRGGDVYSYLDAVRSASSRSTLDTNRRSDAALVDALQVLTRGAALGDPEIVVLPVQASADHAIPRLLGAPHADPVRLRHVRLADGESSAIDHLRGRIAGDLAGDVARLLEAGPTFDGTPLQPRDIAILVQTLSTIGPVRDALAERGIASVITGGSSVFLSEGADEWLSLLEAMEQPQRSGRVRAVALTSLVGRTPGDLDAGGDAASDEVAEQVRTWLDLFRGRGVAAVFEAVTGAGLGERVLARPRGERLMTDLTHLAQILHEAARRERLALPALLSWFRAERRAAVGTDERSRRLDTDASAVQIVTVHGSKGLQYPVVYLPHAFNYHLRPQRDTLVFHDDEQRRVLDVAEVHEDSIALGRYRAEDAGEQLRLTYVALTRAQSQVVLWWAPSRDCVNSGLSRLLLGRTRDAESTPQVLRVVPAEDEVVERLRCWEREGGLAYEESMVHPAAHQPTRLDPPRLGVRVFGRAVDTEWRRTSYSGLIRADEPAVGAVETEPEVEGTVDEAQGDEDGVLPAPAGPPTDTLPSPMEGLPAGATFGSLVHGVLEHADPQAADLLAELRRHVVEQQGWWSVDATPDAIAEALVPMQHTPLGPLADGLTLADLPLRDRLRELDFEFPLAGGDRPAGTLPDVHLRQVAGVLRRHLSADDPMRAYADRLESPVFGDQVLRGYLSGSIDVVLRVPGSRFVVVDYKTNKLGVPDRPLTALDYTQPLMTEAMLHSHYPLQALLYSVVLHRYLRWRLAAYDAERHLGGILYLYVRGMCGPSTPVVEGQPCGVFAWKPPAGLVTELSDLLAGRVRT